MTPNNKILSVGFLGATIALFLMQWYAITQSAQMFGATVVMSWVLASFGAMMPDLLVWLPHLKEWDADEFKKHRNISHFAGFVISLSLGGLFSVMMTNNLSLIGIYMLLQFGLIVAQFATASDAAKVINVMFGGEYQHPDVKRLKDIIKYHGQLTGLLDANNDLLQQTFTDQINDAVRIIVDAIPQPQPVDFAPVFDNQAEMFGGVRDLALLVKIQGERIEELNETVRGLKANKPVVVSTIVDPKKLRTADDRKEFVRTYPWADTEKLSKMWDVSERHITTKYLNGAGK